MHERTTLPHLYLLRHGPAVSTAGSGIARDEERPLTGEGLRVVERAAGGMRRAGIRPGSIFTSPYLRARQTAAVVAEALLGSAGLIRILPEMASGARWEAVQDVLAAEEGLAAALLVGHQPDLSGMTSAILGGGAGISYAPATLACIEVHAIPPVQPGTLRWCRRSEELARLPD